MKNICKFTIPFIAAFIILLSAKAPADDKTCGNDSGSQIQANDTLSIIVPNLSQLSRLYVVSDDGRLNFPAIKEVQIGSVPVAGKETACTLRVIIQGKLAGVVSADKVKQISVYVTAKASSKSNVVLQPVDTLEIDDENNDALKAIRKQYVVSEDGIISFPPVENLNVGDIGVAGRNSVCSRPCSDSDLKSGAEKRADGACVHACSIAELKAELFNRLAALHSTPRNLTIDLANSGLRKDSHIQAGDTIDVQIPASPLLSKQYQVADNGKIYFPVQEDISLGSIGVADRDSICGRPCNAAELQAELQNRVDAVYKDDKNNRKNRVTVDLVTYGSRKEYSVYIYGLVNTQGMYRYTDKMTILDLIIKAGGAAEKADLSNIKIFRGGAALEPKNIRGLMDGSDFTQNFQLMSGDYVAIPRYPDTLKDIRVLALGYVSQVGAIVLPVGSRVLDVLASSQGAKGRAGVGRAYIIRPSADGNSAVPIHVDIKALINRLDMSQNQVLQNGDIFYVPESEGVDIMSTINNLSAVTFFKTLIKNGY